MKRVHFAEYDSVTSYPTNGYVFIRPVHRNRQERFNYR